MTVGHALFSFKGRLSRRDYWFKGFLILLPIGILVNLLTYVVIENLPSNIIAILIQKGIYKKDVEVIYLFFGVVSLWPSLALIVKRLHDRNRSGWFAAWMLVPVAGIAVAIWILIEVWFYKGTVGPNRYGADSVQEVS